MTRGQNKKQAWKWVPSLYFAEGLPYIVVMSASVIMYKRLGVSNTDIALYTSWLYLPWVIKPFWSPVVDILKTKRWWIITMQLLLGAGFAGVALTIPTTDFFKYSLAFLWLVAFSSATHDISIDGFYMLALSKHNQAWFVGIRNTAYRFAMIFGQGLLIIFAGFLETSNLNVSGKISFAWMITFFVLAGLFILFFLYHNYVLPRPEKDRVKRELTFQLFSKEFLQTFVLFFKKKQITVILLFILFYRLGEGQLAKIAAPFLLDSRNAGGLALTTSQVGFAYGTVGVIALIIGGLLGGFVTAKHGLKFWIWWMLAAINLPDLVYVFLSYTQTTSLILINSAIAVEQFGYGFGFTAFLLYLIYISEGKYKTAYYAIATGLMALGMMIPGMISGWLQEMIGYNQFFIWVTVSTVPAFIIAVFLDIDPEFGKKTNIE